MVRAGNLSLIMANEFMSVSVFSVNQLNSGILQRRNSILVGKLFPFFFLRLRTHDLGLSAARVAQGIPSTSAFLSQRLLNSQIPKLSWNPLLPLLEAKDVL